MARPLASACRDIAENIALIDQFTSGKTQQQFSNDALLVAAVERCIERISEASRSIPDHIKMQYPQHPWRDIANIGNILRHRYETIDTGIIWAVVAYDLPALRTVVEKIRQDIGK
jgi:uncharacterized protein with HEPN domain